MTTKADRSEISRAVAKAIAYHDCGKPEISMTYRWVWYRIVHRDHEIEEWQFPSRSKAMEYALHHSAVLYEWDRGWRKVTAY